MAGLPRAYLRMDPNIDQHPDPLAMVRLLCAAARQSKRGRFKDAATLIRILGRRTVAGLIDRADILSLEDGTIYVDGWDEWQEGDWTVAERMRRVRSKGRDMTVTAPSLERIAPSARVSPTPSSTPSLEVGGPGEGEETPPWLRAWLTVKLRMPSSKQNDVILSYLRVFDETGPERAARIFLENPTDPIGALLADRDSFREAAKADAAKAESESAERHRQERKGFKPGSVEYELAQMLYAKEHA